MRKRFRVPLFAAFVGAVVAPVGFALSLESSPTAPLTSAAAPPPISATSLVTSEPVHDRFLPDAAKLLLVGATLFGVAAFVRKAV